MKVAIPHATPSSSTGWNLTDIQTRWLGLLLAGCVIVLIWLHHLHLSIHPLYPSTTLIQHSPSTLASSSSESKSSTLPRVSVPLVECATQPFHYAEAAYLKRQDRYWRDTKNVKYINQLLKDKWILIAGDSTIRYIYFELISLLQGSPQLGVPVTDPQVTAARYRMRHRNQETIIAESNIRISFRWAPYLANITTALKQVLVPDELTSFETSNLIPTPLPDLVLMSAGIWNLMYHPEDATTAVLQSTSSELVELFQSQNWLLKREAWKRRLEGESGPQTHGYDDWEQRSPTFLWLSSPSLLEANLTGHRLENTQFRNYPLQELNQAISTELLQPLPFLQVDTHPISTQRQPEPNDDGLHSLWSSAHLAQSIASFMECAFTTNAGTT